ncbi:carbonic anhydrase [Streptomyces sp. NPDC020965]|uniref:carbonic anhydrase n=1 Tax=Streptomyces sp. NPDC020965 TaxID=3365105 RepID=UPI00379E196B
MSGSIRYGVVELAVPLMIVLGHESCGAVKRALRVVDTDPTLPPMPSPQRHLVDQITLTVNRDPNIPERLNKAIDPNVRMIRNTILTEGPCRRR